MSSLHSIRQQLRKQRKLLTSFQQKQAAYACFSKIMHLSQFQHAKHIGLYLDAFGEIETHLFFLYCFKLKKTVYLPKICEMNQRLTWVKVTKNQYLNYRFSKHQLGMYQPQNHRGIHTQNLDLLFMPLLGCDAYGTRLGMGGGFYDRTLADCPTTPYRVGLAHDFQLISTPLVRRAWDQPIDALCTPSHYHKFNSKRYN